MKTGIVILNYNSSDILRSTLESLYKAVCVQEFNVGIIDNGSNEIEVEKFKKVCADYIDLKLQGFYILSEKNLGFSGGNNVIIKKFMENPEITHICLLNSDVIVTSHWLDRLISVDAEVIGPVTNATGNEQTVAIDYNDKKVEDIFMLSEKYASKRFEVYNSNIVESNLLHFFCTLFKKDVFNKIGLLDEQFYPGSFEDNDFCMRIINNRIKMYVHRGCFVHHFGSQSFEKLAMSNRINIANENRIRFEKKWNVYNQSTSWKLLKSCIDDLNFLNMMANNKSKENAIEIIIKEMKLVEKMMDNLEVESLNRRNEYLNNRKKSNGCAEMFNNEIRVVYDDEFVNNTSGKRMLLLACLKALKKIRNKLFLKTPTTADAYVFNNNMATCISGSNLLRYAMVKFVIKMHIKKSTKSKYIVNTSIAVASENSNEKIYDENWENIVKIARSNDSISVFAPLPTKANERDGYIQRVSAIDKEILQDHIRFYLNNGSSEIDFIKVSFIKKNVYKIDFNGYDDNQIKEILKLVKFTKIAYFHSLLRLFPTSVSSKLQEVLSFENVKKIWDVHGSVPEEFTMYNDKLSAQLSNEVEKKLYNNVDMIVCVNYAMQNHLINKYGRTSAKFTVLPIFTGKISENLNKKMVGKQSLINEKPIIIYAGGTQKWQNIEFMQDVIRKTADLYNYKIFVPESDKFEKTLGMVNNNVVIASKTPEEILKEYEECQYGIAFRNDNVVNNVACPTKIIEYIQNGLVPIFKSEKIGDFVKLGLQYVTVNDLLNKKLPTEEKRHKMAEANYNVLAKLVEIITKGQEILKEYVNVGRQPIVGLVVTTFDKGGLEQVVLNLYNGYKKAGIKTYLFCQKNEVGMMMQYIAQEDLKIFSDNQDMFMSLLKKYQINVLHYHYNIFCMDKAYENGIKIMYTMHNVYTWKNDNEIQYYANVLKSSDVIVPVSSFVEKYFRKRSKSISLNYHTIYNGIDFAELDCNEIIPAITRSGLGISAEDITVSFIASFYPAKGQAGMIGVMEQLLDKHPNIKLLFVGNIGDKPYYDEIVDKLRESPAKGNIIFVPYFEHKYMGGFLRKTTDIFILPTLQEGCSNAVLEAIYCDKPMILTNVGNAQEVRNLKSCIIVKPPYNDIARMTNQDIIATACQKDMQNKKELVAAIIRMYSNLSQYKKNAHILKEEKEEYSTEAMVNNYVKLINQLG
jgi:glycosyltransferase involved in cell wall biosynthesis/GT2 family glycosyltransferase